MRGWSEDEEEWEEVVVLVESNAESSSMGIRNPERSLNLGRALAACEVES